MGRRTYLRRDQVQEGRGLKRGLRIPAKNGRTMGYWQVDHDRPLIDNDAPSWAHHLAEISAILFEARSTLTGNGIEHTLPDALEIVRLVLREREIDRYPRRGSWTP
jgi:hypothetical protein